MTGEDIFQQHIADIDQDLAGCRGHVETLARLMRGQLDAGRSPEREFVSCTASALMHGTGQSALAALLSAAVLMLAERETSRLTEFTIRHTPSRELLTLWHTKCDRLVHVIPDEDWPTPAHFNELARVHLQECLA